MIERLPYNGTTEVEVFQYFHTRALQLAPNGLTWTRVLTKHDAGYITHFTDDVNGATYDSFYVPADKRGGGNGFRLAELCTNKLITVTDCNIVDFLLRARADFCVETGMFDYGEYEAVQRFYGSRRAERSGVFLMNHIDEGLYILHKINASEHAKRAYCLHPMLQADKDLEANFDFVVKKSSNVVIALAMEYRNIANQWLSDKVWMEDGLMPHVAYDSRPVLSPLMGVTQMLRADKIQNYKDFILYHKGKHPRSDELDTYFQVWLKTLNVDSFPIWFDTLDRINPQPTKE